jgi:rhodanese-related sulfurtransferase
MRQITPTELKQWLDDPARAKPFLLDVREPWEFERCRLPDASLVPMRELPARLEALERGQEIVVICHHGVRSFHAARFLEHNGFHQVINLSGGVDAWAKQVDPTMPLY